jgi:prophage antirepressor-like protein
MSGLIPFQFDGREIRVVTDDNGEPWFSAKEICEILDYGNSSQALSSHVDADDLQKLEVIDSMGRKQMANHVNESGLYALIFGSTKDEAKRFKRWVTHEVLPTIRRTGSYVAPQQVARMPQAQPVRDLLLVGKAMAKVKGVNEALAMACTLDAIERTTGLPTMLLAKALPTVAPEDAATLNATQVGEPLNLSGRAANAMLEKLGFQFKDENKNWKLTEAGTAFGEMKPFHRNGHSGYETRWKPSVIEVMRNHAAGEVADA